MVINEKQKYALRRIVRQQEYKKASEEIKIKYKNEPDFYDRVTDEVFPKLLDCGYCDSFSLEEGSYNSGGVILYDIENKEKFIIDYNGEIESQSKYEPESTANYDKIIGICIAMFFVFLVLFIIVGFVIDSTAGTFLIVILGIINIIVGFVTIVKRPLH